MKDMARNSGGLRCVLALLLFVVLFAWGQDRAVEVFRFEEAPGEDDATFLSQGKLALSEGIYPFAVKRFQEYLKKVGRQEPQRFQGTQLLAQAYLKNKQPKEAQKLLEDYLRQANGGISAVQSASLGYLMGQALAQQEQWQAAVDTLEKMCRQPDAPLARNALLLLTDCYMKLEQWNVIRSMLDTESQNHPDYGKDFDVQYRSAETAMAMGEPKKAKDIVDVMQSFVNVQNEVDYYLLTIKSLSLLDMGDKALGTFDKNLQNKLPAEPNHTWWEALVAMGDSLGRIGNVKDALKVYEMASPLSSTKQEKLLSLVKLFQCSLKNHDNGRAKDHHEELRKLFPESSALVNVTADLANALAQNGNNNAAAEYYAMLASFAKTSQPVKYEANRNRCECLVREGRWQDAEAALREAERQSGSPEEKASALYRAGEVVSNWSLGDGDAASKAKLAQRAIGYFKAVADEFAKTTENSLVEKAASARFRQAELTQQYGDYKKAMDCFAQYTREFPEGAKLEEAKLRQGANQRRVALADGKEASMAACHFLATLGDTLKNQELADQAAIEAYLAAEDAQNRKQAEEELTKVLSKPQSTIREKALFQRSLLRFDMGNLDGAREDGERFLQDFPASSLLGELCLLMGDSYANDQDWTHALQYYTKAVKFSEGGKAYPMALYEAAYASCEQKDYQNCLALLGRLLDFSETEAADDRKRIVAQGFYLKGEALSLMHKFDEAKNAYGECRTRAEDSSLGFAAIGRQGEMLLQKAQGLPFNDDATRKAFAEADDCFRLIITTYESKHQKDNPMYIKAMYRLAFSLKLQKENDKALNLYREIYFWYKDNAAQKRAVDDFYLANTILDMCDILEARQDENSLQEARRCYEYLALCNLPVSETARQRARKLRKAESEKR